MAAHYSLYYQLILQFFFIWSILFFRRINRLRLFALVCNGFV